MRTIACKPAGHRYTLADNAHDTGDQFAAVDVQPVRQNKNAGKIARGQCLADRLAAFSRLLRRVRWLTRETNLGGLKTERGNGNLVVADIVVMDLPARTASDDVRVREHRAQFLIAHSICQRFPRAEI